MHVHFVHWEIFDVEVGISLKGAILFDIIGISLMDYLPVHTHKQANSFQFYQRSVVYV